MSKIFLVLIYMNFSEGSPQEVRTEVTFPTWPTCKAAQYRAGFTPSPSNNMIYVGSYCEERD